MDIFMRDWRPREKFDFGVGCSFYFDGKRRAMRKGEFVELPTDHKKQIDTFKHTLKQLSSTAVHEIGPVPFLIISDCSPVDIPFEDLAPLVAPCPLIAVRFERNMGVGVKENVIQHVLAQRCKYVVRFDVDALFDRVSFMELRDGFSALPDAYVIASCITYFARLDASQLPDDVRYFSGSNTGDLMAYRASVFKQVGYVDPAINFNEDGEFRIRCQALLNMFCYVDRTMTGKAPPSGAGRSLEGRISMSRYIDETRPFIKVSYPKDATPRVRFNKKWENDGSKFFIGPCEYAEEIASRVWF